MGQKDNRYNVRALDRAFAILSILSDGKPRTLIELSDEIELSTSTVYRLLASMAYHNYVERDAETGLYRLGLACIELARSYQMSNHIRITALPELRHLRDETAETVHLAVLDNMEVVYLEKLHGLHAIGLMSSQVGGRLLAYCTGLGKAMLAYTDPEEVRAYFSETKFEPFTSTTIRSVHELMEHLEKIRERGYAFDRGEREPEVACIAAPIFGIKGRLEGAISISGPASRLEPLEERHEHIEKILTTARRISQQLGYRGEPPAKHK